MDALSGTSTIRTHRNDRFLQEQGNHHRQTQSTLMENADALSITEKTETHARESTNKPDRVQRE